MTRLETIEQKLEELKKAQAQVVGTETEVYTRIVGYYRSVRNWNRGKKEEYNYRRLFSPEQGSPQAHTRELNQQAEQAPLQGDQGELDFPRDGQGLHYIYFYRTTCPNCPSVKQWLAESSLQGRAFNVDEDRGYEEAVKFQIYASPTVVFIDQEGNEVCRATSVESLDTIFSGEAVTV